MICITYYTTNLYLTTTAVVANCTGCKGTSKSGAVAVARCFHCANYLCTHCAMAHQYMHCFDGHRVTQLTDLQLKQSAKQSGGGATGVTNGHSGSVANTACEDKTINCRLHRNQVSSATAHLRYDFSMYIYRITVVDYL